jgi:hypothetical protein
MVHESPPWMLREEERLSEDLISRSLGRRSDGCGRAVRSGSSGDLSSGESEFLCKRNSKEDGEWMWRWIMMLPTPFTGRRREGRQYCGGKIVNGEWSYSMLLFQREERKW